MSRPTPHQVAQMPDALKSLHETRMTLEDDGYTILTAESKNTVVETELQDGMKQYKVGANVIQLLAVKNNDEGT